MAAISLAVLLVIVVKSFVQGKLIRRKAARAQESQPQYWIDRRDTMLSTVHTEITEGETEIKTIRERLSVLTKERDLVQAKLAASQKSLADLYSINVLHERYRDFSSVATMYGYLATGRCTTIQGHGGVIDTFENDLKLGYIILGLQQISSQLDRIEKYQRSLYREMLRANESLEEISSGVASIAQNVANIDASTTQIKTDAAIAAVASQESAAALRWQNWNAWSTGN